MVKSLPRLVRQVNCDVPTLLEARDRYRRDAGKSHPFASWKSLRRYSDTQHVSKKPPSGLLEHRQVSWKLQAQWSKQLTR
jgi:hypothetical protein